MIQYYSIHKIHLIIFISSVRSSSVYPGLLQTGHFSDFSNLEQSCLYTFIIHFHSLFKVWNRTRQYFCMNYIEKRMHVQISSIFYKVLQIYLRPKMYYISKCVGFNDMYQT